MIFIYKCQGFSVNSKKKFPKPFRLRTNLQTGKVLYNCAVIKKVKKIPQKMAVFPEVRQSPKLEKLKTKTAKKFEYEENNAK